MTTRQPQSRSLFVFAVGAAVGYATARIIVPRQPADAPTPVQPAPPAAEKHEGYVQVVGKKALPALQTLLEARIGKLPAKLVIGKLEKMIENADADAIAGAVRKVAALLADKAPGVVAEIIAVLPESLASDVVSRLPENLRPQAAVKVELR